VGVCGSHGGARRGGGGCRGGGGVSRGIPKHSVWESGEVWWVGRFR
jgi:hypothetical protein